MRDRVTVLPKFGVVPGNAFVVGMADGSVRTVSPTVSERTLPEWLDHLHIRNLRVGNSRVGLDFTRHGDRTFCNVVDIEGEKLLVNIAFKKR